MARAWRSCSSIAAQLGPGAAVIAFRSVVANLAAIVGGILVFRDPIGIGGLAIVGRTIAFVLVLVLVIAGAASMPAPIRAGPQRRTAPEGPPGPMRISIGSTAP